VKQQIDPLVDRISKLESRMSAVESRLNSLEQKVGSMAADIDQARKMQRVPRHWLRML